jgi:2-C-methyl-D-erythritol 4-phosphate cytidylyltransferase / 2-C-methyl-D-erythritol 2,4-cyclodiphosphate synthase
MARCMTVAAIIVAAGKGERAGGGVPKQFALLGGRPLLVHSVDAFLSHPRVSSVHVVIGEGQYDLALSALEGRPVTSLATGGKERKDSVHAGLEAAQASGAKLVLIHDAARPFLSAVMIDRLIDALDAADGALPALPVVDTLAKSGSTIGDVVDRDGLVRVQTPQAFHLDAIMTSHQRWNGGIATDDAQMARAAGFMVIAVEGDPMMDKITVSADFAAAEARLAAGKVSRTGMGYDVHRLEFGKELWLGGILIPHDKGLAGHSDADVALHALVDALLGAAGDGDIGTHFPPSEEQWAGAASTRFVEYARDRIAARGGLIDHVDLTIICEAPKIGPHRSAIRARIAALLQIEQDSVSIKATTTERLGFTGRGEGIAAQAVATVRL